MNADEALSEARRRWPGRACFVDVILGHIYAVGVRGKDGFAFDGEDWEEAFAKADIGEDVLYPPEPPKVVVQVAGKREEEEGD